MIRSIFAERYKKVLIAACLLVIGTGIFNAISQNNHWKELYHDPNDRTYFEENREVLTYADDETGLEVPYSSYKEYRKRKLTFYFNGSPYSQAIVPFSTISKAENYSSEFAYQTNFDTIWEISLLLIIPLLGFMLFFIDQKSGFNQFLFSLGISRKELFKKKMLYLALPILISILVGQSVYALLIHSFIPAPYMNATLGQLFASVISNFSLLFAMFCASIFVGSMVGNFFFGSLTWVVLWIFMTWLPNSVYSLGSAIYMANNITHKQFPRTLFVYAVGKMGGYWLVNLILIILGLLFIIWAYKKFQTLSLENDNAYLLHKESRWPIWLLMTSFTSFVLNLGPFDPWDYFLSRKIYEHADISISGPILTNITVTLIIGCICMVIIFSREIIKGLSTVVNKLNHRTG